MCHPKNWFGADIRKPFFIIFMMFIIITVWIRGNTKGELKYTNTLANCLRMLTFLRSTVHSQTLDYRLLYLQYEQQRCNSQDGWFYSSKVDF